MTPQCANRQREITTPRLSIIDPPNITLIEAPPLKFIKFSLFPHEIQLKIWRAALEPAINHQPRIVAAHTLIPPRTETHEMVRILAQTCTMSRELALPLLKQCQEHEDRHYLAIPRQPPVAVAAAAMAAAAAVAAPPTLAPAIPANNPAGLVTMTAQMNAQINAHLMNAHLNRLESTPLAPLRQIRARERRTYPFDMPGEDLMETHYCLNPLHNHIHVDNDYFLFLDQTTSLLHYENSRFSSIISLVQKIIIPASTLYKILKLSPHQMMMPMPSPDWLFTNAKEVVVILPICADLGEFDDTYGSTQESAKANVALTNDSARWSEASEIPYGLLHFWTDEEMAFFDDSMYSRWMYWSEQNTVQDGMIRLPRRRQRDDSSPHPFWNEKAAEHRKLLAARSKGHNPFDDLDDFHLLFGLCHIWRQVSKSPQRAPQMRFAHIRGLRAYDFLGEALGHGREPVVVNWQNYIPRHSSTEIYNTVTFRRVVRLDSKRTSQRYPVRGKDKESDEGDAVCPLNHLTEAEQQQQEEYWHMCAYSGDENV